MIPAVTDRYGKQFQGEGSNNLLRILTDEEINWMNEQYQNFAASRFPESKPSIRTREDDIKEHHIQTMENVEIALNHYNTNATKSGAPKYELVEAIGSSGFYCVGLWYHVCFTAKPISSSTGGGADPDADGTTPKHFFAEVAHPIGGKDMTVSCWMLDPNSPDTIDGCGTCCSNMMMYHPKGGFQMGKNRRGNRLKPFAEIEEGSYFM